MAKRSKKSKPQQKQVEDRISGLPDCIIILILSFLDTLDSVRTTILSRRWQRLWTHVPNITFTLPSVNMMFIERTLALHAAPKIFKFSLEGDFINLSRRSLHLIVHFLMNRHVEDLNLQGWFDHNVILPQCIFDLDSLRELRMQSCNFSPRMIVSWTSLRVLDVQTADLRSIEKILSGCPVLESLILRVVSVFVSGGPIHIVHNKLKKVVLHYTYWSWSSNSEEKALHLIAPRLQEIDIFPP